jgi:hypothetical protein
MQPGLFCTLRRGRRGGRGRGRRVLRIARVRWRGLFGWVKMTFPRRSYAFNPISDTLHNTRGRNSPPTQRLRRIHLRIIHRQRLPRRHPCRIERHRQRMLPRAKVRAVVQKLPRSEELFLCGIVGGRSVCEGDGERGGGLGSDGAIQCYCVALRIVG